MLVMRGSKDHLFRSLFINSALNLFLSPTLLLSQLIVPESALTALNLVNSLPEALLEDLSASLAPKHHFFSIDSMEYLKSLSRDDISCLVHVIDALIAPV